MTRKAPQPPKRGRRPQARRPARPLEPGDWYGAARHILKTRGFASLTIRDLCAHLGVSTGSYYHHFSGREDFLDKFFEDFFDQQRRVVEAAMAGFDLRSNLGPGALNRSLNDALDHRCEAALRSWSLFDTGVAKQIQRMDESRAAFLASLYAGRLPSDATLSVTTMHLSALIGAQFLFADQPERLNAFGQFVNSLLADLVRQPGAKTLRRAVEAERVARR